MLDNQIIKNIIASSYTQFKMINIRYENSSEDLITRLMKVRWLDTPQVQSRFLNPSFKNNRTSPWLLADMDKGVARILHAIRTAQKIMVFGDYDADGVTSSYILYDFFRTFVRYDNISVQLPHRLEDGYGIKNYHLDQMKAKWVQLVITVDNGITAIEEALHAQKIGLDMVITDHHQPLQADEHGGQNYPQVTALINPQVSPDYEFKWLCGAGVVYKLVMALSEKLGFDEDVKKQVLYRYLPIVSIATVSDCVPLLEENRLFVKKGLELINSDHAYIPQSLKTFLAHFKLTGPNKKALDTTDIGFMIWPRLNAAGRMLSAYEAFYALWFIGDKQKVYLDKLGDLNDERKWIQEDMIKAGIEQLDINQNIMILCGEEYHEGIVGIVAGRLTEKYYKPSMVLKIDREKGIWVASLRGPAYFSVIDMLHHVAPLLDRFGGHKQAWGLTVKVENIETLVRELQDYCNTTITPEMMEKNTNVDTVLLEQDMEIANFKLIDTLNPFWEGNREPVLLLQNAVIKHKQTMGKKNNHLKLYTQCGSKIVEVIQRKRGEDIENFQLNEKYDLVVSHRWDGDHWYLAGE